AHTDDYARRTQPCPPWWRFFRIPPQPPAIGETPLSPRPPAARASTGPARRYQTGPNTAGGSGKVRCASCVRHNGMQGHQANKLHEQTKLDQNIHVGTGKPRPPCCYTLMGLTVYR